MSTTSTPSTKTLAVAEVVFTDAERVALVRSLAGYRGLTHDTYTLDLHQFVSWCEQHGLKLFSVRRSDIDLYARHLEETGRARATVARRLCTVAGFYRYAEEEGLVPTSPAVHVRRPRLDYESHTIGLDRNEVGALLVVAGLGAPSEHALISLLALNGLRVSEAVGANIEALGLERGHRTLTVLRKGGKIVTIPLAPRTARAVDLAIGERLRGPIFIGPDGRRFDRHTAGRIVRRVARRAGSKNRLGLTLCDRPSSPLRSMLGCRYEMYKRLPRTLTPAPQCATTTLPGLTRPPRHLHSRHLRSRGGR